MVRDGDNGLLVPVRDERAVAGALRTLIEAGDLRERMGRRGRERALDEFSVEGFVAASLAVYRTVAGS